MDFGLNANSLVLTSFVLAFAFNGFFKRLLKCCGPTIAEKQPPPPSPPALPFIGHLHLIGRVLPVSLQSLARRYGPLMAIRLGASTCVVASDSSSAKEIFKTQELNFCSRPEFGSAEYFIYRGSRFILAQYGDYWRFMKKLCMTKLLAVPQLEKFADIREEEKIKLVESVADCCRDRRPCELGGRFTTYTNNIICRMAMSTRCSGNDNEAEEIKELIKTCLEFAGKVSIGDVLGPLKVLDFSGNGKKLVAAMKKYDRLVERVIKEHEAKVMEEASSDAVRTRKDILHILLETYKDPAAEVKLTRNDIKSFLLDIFMAGADTSSAAMQWAMGELINHPQALKKLREEIDTVVGSKRLVKESDVENLPYLRAVIRETLRLHPSAPLIIRECGEDCQVNGYLPFGSGRRGCAGASLAMYVMHLAVGALVQRFDWQIVGGEKADLSQGPGFAAEMARPLLCHPTDRFNPL
ncbi:PREDICTED: 3,9-dihydroxypterocarpan 6A-monooxygenase isoform X2 [Tarenaya hassleriana]|uniref:3,9-dihydroxypterocarpan 6A-monooxygenase isoform X2 n=1 Tax=Tarenaya hassleriana TaxID=28532 RepID=UPI00053C4EFA|nr:PREDICTED: 3,9-dihydroxypterocarpan 6A-monooxygenase isoform X2 [Tarenaya hassleriana]